MQYDPEPMDYIRDALANALHSGLTLEDVLEASIYADDVEAFNEAVNVLGLAVIPFAVE